MSEFSRPDTSSWQGIVPLPHLGLIQAEGPDSASFLHGQLSQDVQLLNPGEARLGAYCTAKGRMLADVLLFKPSAEQVWLLLGQDILAGTLKRLSMFVLRAKTRLRAAGDDLALRGVLGQATVQAVTGGTMPSEMSVTALPDQGQLIRLRDVQGVARAIWIGPQPHAHNLSTLGGGLGEAPEGAWAWLDVMSGVPRIEAATLEQFVPQMINFEVIGGVNFKKGCYPGQEIVARSQYRGTVKRRLHLAHTLGPARAGQDVLTDRDPTQPAGMVVNVAQAPGQAHQSVLLELKLEQANHALHLGEPEGPGAALTLVALPYEIPTQDA